MLVVSITAKGRDAAVHHEHHEERRQTQRGGYKWVAISVCDVCCAESSMVRSPLKLDPFVHSENSLRKI
jgi:hypothetical protein